MTLRSPRERFTQTLTFEIVGLFMSVPLYVLVTGGGAGDGAMLMATLAMVVMLWSPLHNAVFDLVDLRLTGRVASDRPHRWRLVHAISHGVTVAVVTLPIMLWLGGFTIWEALLAEIGLTLAYTVYAYGFHLVYDRLRPVGRASAGPITS
jgi:uncharacterized membrane protein